MVLRNIKGSPLPQGFPLTGYLPIASLKHFLFKIPLISANLLTSDTIDMSSKQTIVLDLFTYVDVRTDLSQWQKPGHRPIYTICTIDPSHQPAEFNEQSWEKWRDATDAKIWKAMPKTSDSAIWGGEWEAIEKLVLDTASKCTFDTIGDKAVEISRHLVVKGTKADAIAERGLGGPADSETEE